jgi:hypothetical protein
MIGFLQGKAMDKKLRLFACAYCRRLATPIDDERPGRIIAAMEHLADGLVDVGQEDAACTNLGDTPNDARGLVVMDFVEDCANTSDGWAAADFVVRAIGRITDVSVEWLSRPT